MSTPKYSSLAAQLLARHAGRGREPSPAERVAAVQCIEAALFAKRRRRHRIFTASVGGAFAAAAALVLFVTTRDAPGPAVASAGVAGQVTVRGFAEGDAPLLLGPRGAEAFPDGMELDAGQTVVTSAEGHARIELSTGTRLRLEASTQLRLDARDARQAFFLEAGRLRAEIAKLHDGQRFLVSTPDAEVEVRGTEFELEVSDQPLSCAPPGRTRLTVREGVVEVRSNGRSLRVARGETWPASCALVLAGEATPGRGQSGNDPVDESSPPPTNPRREAPPHPARVSSTATSPAPSSEPVVSTVPRISSRLLEQNNLFAEAVAARQRGDVGAALTAYDRLVRQYPDSPLVENAVVERMRLLRAGHPAEARTEARRYLARFPRGFARKEAEETAGTADDAARATPD